MATRQIKAVLKPYSGLNEQFTQIANTMILHIKDTYYLKVYLYLCMRYNRDYNYAFPTLNTISSECAISLRKVKSAIKWLSDEGYILKGKYKGNSSNKNNTYYIRYLYIDKKDIDNEMLSVLPDEEEGLINIEVPDELETSMDM